MTATIAVSGNLFNDPELTTFNSGTKQLTFTLKSYTGQKKKEGEQYAPADFFKVKVQGPQVDRLMSVLKGPNKEAGTLGTFVSVTGTFFVDKFDYEKNGERIKGQSLVINFAQVGYDISLNNDIKPPTDTKKATVDEEFEF